MSTLKQPNVGRRWVTLYLPLGKLHGQKELTISWARLITKCQSFRQVLGDVINPKRKAKDSQHLGNVFILACDSCNETDSADYAKKKIPTRRRYQHRAKKENPMKRTWT
jgi:hypothetical protein